MDYGMHQVEISLDLTTRKEIKLAMEFKPILLQFQRYLLVADENLGQGKPISKLFGKLFTSDS